MSAKYEVGQEVYVRGGLSRLPGKVVKVGRTLVHVEHGGRVESYRMDTGRRATKYGDLYLETPAQRAARDLYSDLLDEIKAAGWSPHPSLRRPSIEELQHLAAAVRDIPDPDQRRNP